MLYFFASFLFMYIGRKTGWLLSRRVLYTAPGWIAFILTFIWGLVVATVVLSLIAWRQPGPVLKWVMGYALGAYVAVPNYGLLIESTIPDTARDRHAMVSVTSVTVYALNILPIIFGIAKF